MGQVCLSDIKAFKNGTILPFYTPSFLFRLFFRINQIYRNGSANLDLEDDEEELVWDEEVEVKEEVEEPTAHVDQEVKEDVGIEDGSNTKSGSSQTLRVPSADHGTSTYVDTASRGAQTASSSAATTLDPATDAREVAQIISLNEHMKERVQVLESDNQRLVSHEEELLRRIEELEARLAAQEIAQAAAAMLAVPSSISVEESTVRAAEVTVTPPSKRRPASKAAAPSTTPATQGYFDATTPPVAAAPSTKKKGSTAKKLFDSPAAVPLKEEESVAAAPAPVVVAESAVVPAPAVHVSDHVSQSSDESAVVVNHSDNALEDDLPAPAPRTSSSSTSGTAGVADAKGTKGAFSSQETAKYLAALDDQDEEEDGWN